MSEIDLKLKTYDELTFEITRLNTDKYLLEQKLQQKENKEKEIKEYLDYIKEKQKIVGVYTKNVHKHILEILDKENKQ